MNIVTRNAPRLVGDLTTAAPVVIRADAHPTDAAKLPDQHDAHGLPVIGETGNLLGVISQTNHAPASPERADATGAAGDGE